MIRLLSVGTIVAWALGAIAMPIAAWIWLRRGGRRPAVVIVGFAAGFVAQAAWLFEVASRGPVVLLEPGKGMDGWAAWGLGVTGVVALLSGARAVVERGRRGLLEPDRALETALGLFGVGILLQQIARAIA